LSCSSGLFYNQSRQPKSVIRINTSASSSISSSSSGGGGQLEECPRKNPRIVHCNHAGASPSPDSVVDAIWRHLKLEQNIGGYTAAEMASQSLHQVYERAAKLLNCKSAMKGSEISPEQEIALVESATVGWTRLFYAMAQYQHERRRTKPVRQQQHQSVQQSSTKQPLVILVSEAEYAANVVAACKWARDHESSIGPSWTTLAIPSSRTSDANGKNKSTGQVDLQALKRMLKGTYQFTCLNGKEKEGTIETLDPANIAMICVTHIGTNSGLVNDVESIGKLIAGYNQKQQRQAIKEDDAIPSILYLVDACQSVGQRQVDVQKIQCHGLVGTGRKYLRGPRGTGFLYAPWHIAEHLMPHHVDHFGVPVVSVPVSSGPRVPLPVERLIETRPKPGASRFEFYESSIANKLGLGEAIRYAMDEVGVKSIQSTTTELAQDLFKRLQSMDNVIVHHAPECGIVTFHCAAIPSKVTKQSLWGDGTDTQFETSVVPATSTPLDSSETHVPDLVRVSLTYTNTGEDLDLLCQKLQRILNDGI